MREGEAGNVAARGEIDPDFIGVLRFLIVLRDALADFCGRHPYDWIGVGVVVRGAVKNLNTEETLLELRTLAFFSLLYQIFQQSGVPMAVAEVMTFQHPLELDFNLPGTDVVLLDFQFCGWHRLLLRTRPNDSGWQWNDNRNMSDPAHAHGATYGTGTKKLILPAKLTFFWA
jgi:hypothetical protein